MLALQVITRNKKIKLKISLSIKASLNSTSTSPPPSLETLFFSQYLYHHLCSSRSHKPSIFLFIFKPSSSTCARASPTYLEGQAPFRQHRGLDSFRLLVQTSLAAEWLKRQPNYVAAPPLSIGDPPLNRIDPESNASREGPAAF